MTPNANLRNLLVIKDLENETIYDVIGRMEVLLKLFESQNKYRNLVPFLYTYLLVTKSVAQKYSSRKEFFSDLKGLEELDIYFASLYFKPLLAYLKNGEKKHPWKTYFDYTSKSDAFPFLTLILGINAHINSDLYFSIKTLDYKNEKDYFKVNDILLEVIPDVMKLLIKEHDLVGISSLVLKSFIENEFHLIVERWRSEVWAKSKITKKIDKNVKNKTEEIGKDLIITISNFYNLHALPSDINKLNKLSVI